MMDDKSPTEENKLGEVCLALRYVPDKQKFSVHVMECRGLKKMDYIGLSDPYVKIYLMMGNKRLDKRKTTTKWKTLNPYFNEPFTFDNMPPDKIKKIHLVVTVIDYDRVGANEPIGQVYIGRNSDSNQTLRQWADMLTKPGKSFAEWHGLQPIKAGLSGNHSLIARIKSF